MTFYNRLFTILALQIKLQLSKAFGIVQVLTPPLQLILMLLVYLWQKFNQQGGGTDINIPQDLAENLNFPFEVTLSATETLDCSQNTGTNAATLLIAEVEEFNI